MRVLRPLSEYAWRGLVVALAVAVVVYALIQLKVVVLPLGIALLFATFLAPLVDRFEARGLKRSLATAIVFLSFLGSLGVIIFLIAPPVGDQFSELGPTVSQGVEDVQQWLIDGPLDLSRQQVDDYRSQMGDYARRALRSSSDQLIAGAVIIAEILAGSLLTLLAAFFLVKDGPKMQRWILERVAAERREVISACASRAWNALGGFLRGAALIGALEAVVMGIALAIVGADLVVPVAVLTFFAAFFPVLGAIVAGIIAALVALVSGGPADAAVIAVVALVVQQFDNDLLAPVIYGRALRLHPLVVVSALTAGATLGGIIGAFLAVPLTAVVVAVGGELRGRLSEGAAPDGAPAPATAGRGTPPPPDTEG